MKNSIISLVILLAGISFAFTQPSLELVWKRTLPSGISAAKFSKDGNFIYCAIGNNIQIIDAKTGEFTGSFDNTGITHDLSDFQISTNGETISTALLGEGAAIWDTKQMKILRKFKPDSTINNESSWIECTSVYPNGKFALFGQITLGNKPTSDAKTSIILFDIEQGKEVQRIQQSVRINQIQISHDGRYFVTGSTVKNFDNTYNDQLLLWDAVTFQQIAVLENTKDIDFSTGYRMIVISPDNKFIGTIKNAYSGPQVYDVNQRKQTRNSTERPCKTIKFLSDSASYIAAFGLDGSEIYGNQNNLFSYSNKNILSSQYSTIRNDQNEDLILVIGDSLLLYKLKSISSIINENPLDIEIINNRLILKSTNYINENYKLIITDILGKIYLQQEINYLDVNQVYPLNLNLPSGIYLCKITAGNKEFNQKIEIVR